MASTITGRAIGAYALIIAAIAAGIAGMGLVFDAATGGTLNELGLGLPLLLVGLWWASREMKRSMDARRLSKSQVTSRTSHAGRNVQGAPEASSGRNRKADS